MLPVAALSLVSLGYGQDQLPVVPAQVPTPAPAVLENKGKPMELAYQCTAEDIRWAGLACTDEDPCPIYLDLEASEAAGNRIVVAGNIHSDAATLYSVLLTSEDNGSTWTEPQARIRGAALDRIQFANSETGWISGQTVSPLPEDPFLLGTTDGGKTWRQQSIFSEGRFGSIQQFYFDSKLDGGLIIDQGPSAEGERYARFESRDGGDSWTIREANRRLLTLKHPAAPPAVWRVQADAATHSFHIEHRQGTRWASVASFAVRLAPCKPVEPGGLDPAPDPAGSRLPPAR
jgi:hypothetical protein